MVWTKAQSLVLFQTVCERIFYFQWFHLKSFTLNYYATQWGCKCYKIQYQLVNCVQTIKMGCEIGQNILSGSTKEFLAQYK